MRKLVEKSGVRLLALILFFLFSAGSVLAFCLYSSALEDGWYGKEDYTFADTSMALNYTRDALVFVAQNLAWLGDPNDDTLGSYGGSAFAYRVEDHGTGDLYADTTTEDSYFVCEYPQPVVSETDGRTYRLYGYVNLPVQPYGGCYREYYVFEQLFGLRRLFLPAGIALALLALAALVINAVGAFLLGKNGALTLLGRMPFDGAVIGLFLAAALIRSFLYGSIPYAMYSIMAQVGLYERRFRTVFDLWTCGLLLLALINQLAAHQWSKRLFLRKVLERLSTGVILGIIFAVHVGVLLILVAPYYSFFSIVEPIYLLLDYKIQYIPLVLIVFDVLMLVFAIFWNREKKRVKQAMAALARGELNYKLDTERLHFLWHDMGRDLNSIGDGMAVAVEERLRSERMKTELITNVSHDLKTPLTSIINYISLLKEEDLPPETQKEYLDVLDRQSAKLKKLTEDVVEASKAASGVIPVHAELLDVTELLEQSVGEYAERLEEAKITPIIHTPERGAYVIADGRLLGRVLDNFITNIIKYAQPGTRAYFDLALEQNNAVIAVKNTSSAPLDMPAEELMERFVRGDSSRSSEGSGLGLSIARSLTELMGGQLQLTLDGDLFKAEIIFPAAEAPAPEPTPENENTQNEAASPV